MSASRNFRSILRPVRLIRGALVVAILTGALGAPCLHAGDEKGLLAPTGSLRVRVYRGSPTSMIIDPATGQTHGLAYDLGQEFTRRAMMDEMLQQQLDADLAEESRQFFRALLRDDADLFEDDDE
jgi:hypothetical protein